MIFIDTTNASRSRHLSGLQRVSSCLRAGLGARSDSAVREVIWREGSWTGADGKPVGPGADDWLLTPEVFSADERPGFAAWLASPGCETAAIYYDAIPLKLPSITWPRSVARHPGYMKQLARFDRVLAISEASRRELVDYWEWARAPVRAKVSVIPLGADGSGTPRVTERPVVEPAPSLVMVGIVEPRKNQALMLDVCSRLWESGLAFDLHIVGRVNPHFGNSIAKHAVDLARRHSCLHFHGPLDDSTVRALHARARAALFPSRAEGNGLPVLEALWQGVPCVCSRIPALEENAVGGGCLLVNSDHSEGWESAIRSIVTEDALVASLRDQALSRPLPTWHDTAEAVVAALNLGRT
ncbi:MAG TPA: glycosyltransferase [Opitutaceae bacterium]|nr:glycosyltransferase [Opitutaceae bacterium]